MKVLVLGLPRTGTQSIADALVQLGISPVYHMREVGKNKHQAPWIEAMRAKWGEGREWRPWTRGDFEGILAGFEGVADYPAAIFPVELMAAYPEAAVVLSVRPEDAWYRSMAATLIHYQTHRPKDEQLSPMLELSSMYHRHCWADNFPSNGRAFFHAHNDLVRDAAAAGGRKFLEYEPGSGWEPLCEFLGMEVPQGPFPRSDDWAEYKKMVEEEERKKVQGQGDS